jgi:predicted transposase/invertase (TIGR01784 family)
LRSINSHNKKEKAMVQLPNRLVSMLSDYGFKITFGNQKDTTFIRNALPLLMKSSMKVKQVKHLPTEIVAMTDSMRKGFYDTILRVNDEMYFIVEMQLGQHTYLIERLMFYLSFLYVSKIKKGKDAFNDVKKVHCICITRDTLFPEVTEYYHKSNFRTETGMLISDKMEFIFVELEKFTKLASELNNELEELLFTMKNAHTIDLENRANVPAFWKKSWYTKTMKELNLSKMSSENRLIYELAWARIAATAMQDEIDTKRWKAEVEEKVTEEVTSKVTEVVTSKVTEEVTNKVTEEVTNKVTEEVTNKVTSKVKRETIEKFLKMGVAVETIAEGNNVSIDFVLDIKAKMQ